MPSDQELLAQRDRRIVVLQEESAVLQATVERLEALVVQLQARVAELEAELGRHSGNSSKPPSADTLTQRAAQKARRDAWTKKQKKYRPGKQPGAPGAHLAQVEHPDRILRHVPERCGACGASLEHAAVLGEQARQVFDLPEIKVLVSEHVAESRRCSCGTLTTAPFPAEATAPACFGPVLRGVACYLIVRQHIPIARCAELLSEVLGVPVSTGWLASLLPEAEEALSEFSADLRARLIASDVIHNDETGARISGTRFWFHDASTDLLTQITCHRNRGKLAMDAAGVLPEFSGVSVHDRYPQYWLYPCTHAICNAHLLRDLAAVADDPHQAAWAEPMAKLLVAAKEMVEAARDKGEEELSARQLKEIGARYDTIIIDAIRANPDPLLLGRLKRTKLEREPFNLAVAFADHKDEILRFITDLRVPFDNNQSERDFRMVKIRQKISGGNRSLKGAECFCAVWSYISTARKHGAGVLGALVQMFKGAPWAIPNSTPT